MVSEDLKKKIVRYWTDPSNPAAFSGLERFRDFLAREKKIEIGKTDLYYILRSIPAYVKKIKAPAKLKRRHAEVSGSDLWWSADLCFFKGHTQAFLIIIDAFNLKIKAEPVSSKKFDDVSKALKKVIRDNDGVAPQKLETDAAKEFVSAEMNQFYEKYHIHHLIKYGSNKAFFAENAIRRVKEKIAMAREFSSSSNPPELTFLVQQAVDNLNDNPSSRLGGLKPSEIDHRYDDPKVRAMRDAARPDLKPITWREMESNQKSYESNKRNPYQTGALVFHTPEGRLNFQKSKKLGALYRIRQVRAEKSPPMFKLETLSGHPLKKTFYREEIQFANLKPKQRIYDIEKVVRKRTRLGKTQYLVKYKNHDKLHVSSSSHICFSRARAIFHQSQAHLARKKGAFFTFAQFVSTENGRPFRDQKFYVVKFGGPFRDQFYVCSTFCAPFSRPEICM